MGLKEDPIADRIWSRSRIPPHGGGLPIAGHKRPDCTCAAVARTSDSRRKETLMVAIFQTFPHTAHDPAHNHTRECKKQARQRCMATTTIGSQIGH